MNMPKHKGKLKLKVIVAMSGGVDSSVTAALLKKRGFEVEGVHMRLWAEAQDMKQTRNKNTKPTRKIGAQTRSAEEHARAVAEKLGIGFRVLDFRKEFEKKVIDYFLREFAAGRTPNPCVVCNLEIKFGLLFKKAMEMGADYVATGHYARINSRVVKIKNEKGKTTIKNSKLTYRLMTAKDETKDQSYFLYNLTQEKLAKILFPIGDYKKTEIYKMAKKWQLPYREGESFDICFIADKDHKEFLRKYLKPKQGKIIDVSDKVLGEHRGLVFYTIGQRADIGGPGPFYVVGLDTDRNIVIVSNNPREPMLYKKSLIAENLNWSAGVAPKMPLRCGVKIRYGHEAMPATIWGGSTSSGGRTSRKLKVEFKAPQRAVTPGQSVVFYKRNEVLGGGVIS